MTDQKGRNLDLHHSMSGVENAPYICLLLQNHVSGPSLCALSLTRSYIFSLRSDLMDRASFPFFIYSLVSNISIKRYPCALRYFILVMIYLPNSLLCHSFSTCWLYYLLCWLYANWRIVSLPGTAGTPWPPSLCVPLFLQVSPKTRVQALFHARPYCLPSLTIDQTPWCMSLLPAPTRCSHANCHLSSFLTSSLKQIHFLLTVVPIFFQVGP